MTLKSLAFEPLPQATDVPPVGLFSFGEINTMTLIQTAVLALVTLILGLFVIRPVLASAGRKQALPAPMATLALPGVTNFDGQRVLTGEIEEGPELPPLSVVSGVPGTAAAKDPMSRLRQLIEERQTESVEILRGWMEVEEEVR